MPLTTFRIIFVAASLALVLAPLYTRLAPRAGLMDIPGSLPHKQHSRSVPLVGGLVIITACLLTAWLEGVFADTSIRSILAASVFVIIFGLWDDLKGLSAPVKLVGQGLATLVLFQSGIVVRLFSPELSWVNTFITVFWILGITNAYNFVDSMDGLAVGLAGLAAAFFMLVTQDAGQVALSSFTTIILGAAIGTFFYNASPAKLFLGDTGSQWLGFCLAAVAIQYTPQGFLRSQSWFIPILLVGIPIFDTTLVVFSRLRRGRPVYKAGMDHTYHRLKAMGMDRNRAVLTMHLAALLLGCLAFIALSLPPLWANILFGSCLALGVLAIMWLDNKKNWSLSPPHE